MSDWKFGDMVQSDDGLYMVVAPYTGERLANDQVGPAHWIADINTEYTAAGESGVIWTIDEELEPTT